ncbi:TPA: VRR-NUC domain-containing protein [Burkholderia cenocepacia]|nr:VRR-NUC domain-containing protein [Burkholderia cenocepacia]
MLEKTVETYLVDRVRAAGGDAYKFTSPARVSVPDRIVVFPPARIYFVELKRPGGKLTRGQEREHERLRALGCDVRVIDSREAVDAFVREASVAVAPGDERAAFDMRSFEEWLDQQRDADVASVFHEIVARVTQLRAAASPADDEGNFDEPAHSERNGMVLAFNAVAQLSPELPRIYPDEMSAALRDVLGRPNFWCSPIAHEMRAAGADIKRKAEDEQAHVLHWLVKLVLAYGDSWQEYAAIDLRAIREAADARRADLAGGAA